MARLGGANWSPAGRARTNVERHVVEELPEHRVAEAVVVQVAGLLVEVDGRVALAVQRRGQLLALRPLLDVHACGTAGQRYSGTT